MAATHPRPILAPVYRKALKTWRLVIFYFANENCPACKWASPVFRQVAEPFRHRADIYMLNTHETPRHPLVSGTPTVLFYQDGILLKKLKGFANEETLSEDFARYIGKTKARAVPHKHKHDLTWLRSTLRTLCTLPRTAGRRNVPSGAKIA
jgi:thioredoxin 1